MNRLSINEINSDQLDELQSCASATEAWRRKAIRRALAISKLRGTIEACRDLVGEPITDRSLWGEGYRAAIDDLREVLQAFGQLEAAHDGPSVAEATADDRRWWGGEKAGDR